MRRLLLALTIVAACSSGGGGSTASTGPSVQQVASIVAEHASRLRADLDASHRCTTCSAEEILTNANTAVSHALTFSNYLQNAQPWPAELRELAQRTVDTVNSLQTAHSTFRECTSRAGRLSECSAPADRLVVAFGALTGVLDAWKPYTG